MDGDWNGILRHPRWAEVLSRRDGEQLKDKARNMKLVRRTDRDKVNSGAQRASHIPYATGHTHVYTHTPLA
jgi:hypothetical protein